MNKLDRINKIEKELAILKSEYKDEQNASSEVMPIPEGIKLSSAGIIVNNGRTLMEIDCGLVELTNYKKGDAWTNRSDEFQLKKITFGEIVEGDRILACDDSGDYSYLIYWYVFDEGLRAYWYDERIRTSIYESNIKTYNELWKVVSKE